MQCDRLDFTLDTSRIIRSRFDFWNKLNKEFEKIQDDFFGRNITAVFSIKIRENGIR